MIFSRHEDDESDVHEHCGDRWLVVSSEIRKRLARSARQILL
jgi:hypothetical protein